MADESRGMMTYDGEAGPVQTYLARPRMEGPRPAVIVIHEIVGLTDHIKSVADRFAEEGYVAFAPHLFSRPGLAEVLTPVLATCGICPSDEAFENILPCLPYYAPRANAICERFLGSVRRSSAYLA